MTNQHEKRVEVAQLRAAYTATHTRANAFRLLNREHLEKKNERSFETRRNTNLRNGVAGLECQGLESHIAGLR
jgi:hypothetical protein